ncbi:DUF6480 family protein [Streptomyces sp. NPDC088744]|uniref:DUF6480 family protein n=2 Tax=unclassified Streptomyces TaxID=2593676 RepID=UPI00344C8E82
MRSAPFPGCLRTALCRWPRGRSPRGAPQPGEEDSGGMAVLVNPPEETPPAEGSIGDAHQERPDGGVWEHPAVWIGLIVLGALLVAGFFVARVVGLA